VLGGTCPPVAVIGAQMLGGKQIAIARGAALGDENGWCARCPPTPVCLGSMRDR
jgi:hypothetical protein